MVRLSDTPNLCPHLRGVNPHVLHFPSAERTVQEGHGMESRGVKGWLQRLLGGRETPVLVEYAKCPACRCQHAVASFSAYRHAPNGRSVIHEVSGVVVKCCGCGLVYTVLADGSVLSGKKREEPRNREERLHPLRNYAHLDADLEDFS